LCDLSSGIIQSVVAYDNYDDFQHVNFIFSQNFICLFSGLFNDETDLRVRYFMLGEEAGSCKPPLIFGGYNPQSRGGPGGQAIRAIP